MRQDSPTSCKERGFANPILSETCILRYFQALEPPQLMMNHRLQSAPRLKRIQSPPPLRSTQVATRDLPLFTKFSLTTSKNSVINEVPIPQPTPPKPYDVPPFHPSSPKTSTNLQHPPTMRTLFILLLTFLLLATTITITLIILTTQGFCLYILIFQISTCEKNIKSGTCTKTLNAPEGGLKATYTCVGRGKKEASVTLKDALKMVDEFAVGELISRVIMGEGMGRL